MLGGLSCSEVKHKRLPRQCTLSFLDLGFMKLQHLVGIGVLWLAGSALPLHTISNHGIAIDCRGAAGMPLTSTLGLQESMCDSKRYCIYHMPDLSINTIEAIPEAGIETGLPTTTAL
ncbi:hypothetical protein BJY00DRAFT_228971 [Aspergillus carlsbadensis]|nr:hypothetical protein BJY00DRAFT_228971 [Aspergillus carlsbadensis]